MTEKSPEIDAEVGHVPVFDGAEERKAVAYNEGKAFLGGEEMVEQYGYVTRG